MNRAVVFAYHNVGVRCLSVLLARGVDVCLVISHEDSADENIWFESVAALADRAGIPLSCPEDPNSTEFIERIRSLNADFLFSFYYRHMLSIELLETAPRGAFNMHGSLLPAYRGRVPVNWAVLNGETVTGASLHEMVEKPDAGRLVDQVPVPILANDTAADVFRKVEVAAEIALNRSLSGLLDGTIALRPMDLSAGSYFGGRKPEDGRVDPRWPAQQVHNLIRAVAPPYPGAFVDIRGKRLMLLGSYFSGENSADKQGRARIYWHDGRCYLDAVDGQRLLLTRLAVENVALTAQSFAELFGTNAIELDGRNADEDDIAD